MHLYRFLLATALCTHLVAETKTLSGNLPLAATRPIDFKTEVYPIFKAACFRCHGAEKQKGKYRIDTREGAFKTTENHGPSFQPGDSKKSAALLMMAGLIDEMLMPPPGGKPGESDPLTPQQIGLVRAWVDQGALWPEGPIIETVQLLTFVHDVQPLLTTACSQCHSGKSAVGGFRIDSLAELLAGGDTYGKAVNPSTPEKSPLLAIVSGKDEDISKPEKHRLSEKQVQLLQTWIRQGAH